MKGYGSYTIPRIDVQFSGTYQTKPGPLVLALYTATNAEVAPGLGRGPIICPTCLRDPRRGGALIRTPPFLRLYR